MKNIILFFVIILITNVETSSANNQSSYFFPQIVVKKDSARLAELDQFWTELTRTVQEGDFEGYVAKYHNDAVVVFASGKNKTSVSLSKALAGWKEGFMKTKEGKQNDTVKFRFSQRIGDNSTAHETGIFRFTSINSDRKLIAEYTLHFEMLLIKLDGKWYGLMEYQKSAATDEEWNALE